MDTKFLDNIKNTKNIVKILIIVAVSLLIEIFIFNLSSWRTLGLNEMEVAVEAVTDDSGIYESDNLEINDDVYNVYVSDVILFNCESAEVTVTLTDEGDEYAYSMPAYRMVPQVASSGYANIHPYGKVGRLSVQIKVPEGSAAAAGRIVVNAHKPVDIKPIRLLIIFMLIFLAYLICNDGMHKDAGLLPCAKGSKLQYAVIAVVVLLLIVLGKKLSVSNNLIVSCPWPHHKQYQELAVALSGGTVALENMEVPKELLEKENPYDTIALTAEGIFYNMDYAYFNGKYYVYFGIIPELLLYYPHFVRTGAPLANYVAQFELYIFLVLGVFLTIWELVHRYGRKDGECRVPFVVYMLLATGTVLFSNNLYLISRADIYNIPVMGATAFTWFGIGMWLHGLSADKKWIRIVSLAVGSLSMAMAVGCRPQFALYSLPAIVLFLFAEGDTSSLSIKNRRLFTKDSLGETIAFCLPYVVIAVIVCWYNQARFGSILDFGATYSMTTNDMNHRGFNLDRLVRGLYSFLFQPAVTTTDFPYMESAIVDSYYMGKNLAEFTYGGCFATNIMLLSVFTPLFGMWKKMSNEVKAVFVTLVSSALVIAAFDVNGAGILYRYTCDFVPGMVMAALIVWMVILAEGNDRKLSVKLLSLCVIAGMMYGFRVFLAAGDSVNLHDNSVVLYESIRSHFRF